VVVYHADSKVVGKKMKGMKIVENLLKKRVEEALKIENKILKNFFKVFYQ